MRIFYAITLSDKTKMKMAHYRDELCKYTTKGRFTSTENFHLTLEFIGEVKQSDLPMYEEILDHLYVDNLNMTIDHIGLFKKKKGDVLWLGLKKNPELTRLQNNLKMLLETYEVSVEARKYHPHITLGRQVNLSITASDYVFPPMELEAKSIALMISHRVNDKLLYEPIYERAL